MYTFDHISEKQRQRPDQQVDSGPWIVRLCENNSGLNSPSGWHSTPSRVRSITVILASTKHVYNIYIMLDQRRAQRDTSL